MVKEQATARQQRLKKFLQAVEAAQKLQDDILKYGLSAAYLYCDDVDGDWLEKWDKEEQQENFAQLLAVFLQSNDLVAVTLRKHLPDKSIPEITLELEKCLNLAEEDRIFAIKDLLVSSLTPQESNREANNINDEINLMDLAKSLLKKLVEFHKITSSAEI